MLWEKDDKWRRSKNIRHTIHSATKNKKLKNIDCEKGWLVRFSLIILVWRYFWYSENCFSPYSAFPVKKKGNCKTYWIMKEEWSSWTIRKNVVGVPSWVFSTQSEASIQHPPFSITIRRIKRKRNEKFKKNGEKWEKNRSTPFFYRHGETIFIATYPSQLWSSLAIFEKKKRTGKVKSAWIVKDGKKSCTQVCR